MKRKVRVYKDESIHKHEGADFNKVAKFFRDSAKHNRKLGGDTAEQNQSINSMNGDKLGMFKQKLSNNAMEALVEEELYNVDQAFQYGGDNNPSFSAFGYDPSRAGTDMYADRYYQGALRNQQAKQNFWGGIGNALDDSWGDKAKSKLTDEGKAFVKAQKNNSMGHTGQGYQKGGVPKAQLANVPGMNTLDNSWFDKYKAPSQTPEGPPIPLAPPTVGDEVSDYKKKALQDAINSEVQYRTDQIGAAKGTARWIGEELQKAIKDGADINEINRRQKQYDDLLALEEQRKVELDWYSDEKHYSVNKDGNYALTNGNSRKDSSMLSPEELADFTGVIPSKEDVTIGNTPAEPIVTGEGTEAATPGSTASGTNKKVADLGKNKVATDPIEDVTEGNVNPNEDTSTADGTGAGNTMRDELGRISARSRAFGAKHDFLYDPNNTHLSKVNTRRALLPGNRVKSLEFEHNVPQSEYDRVMGQGAFQPNVIKGPGDSKILPAFQQANDGPIMDENKFWKDDQGLRGLKKLPPMAAPPVQRIEAEDEDVLQRYGGASLPKAQMGVNQIFTGPDGPTSDPNAPGVNMANTTIKEGFDGKTLGKQMLGPGMDMIAAFGRNRTEPDFQQQMMDSTSANNVFTPNDEVDRGMNTFNQMGVPDPYGAKSAPQFTGMARFGGPEYQQGGPTFDYRQLPPNEYSMAPQPNFDYNKLPMMEAAELGFIPEYDVSSIAPSPYEMLALNEHQYQQGGRVNAEGQTVYDNPYYSTEQGRAGFARKQELGFPIQQVGEFPVPHVADADPQYANYSNKGRANAFGTYNPETQAYGVPVSAPAPTDQLASHPEFQGGGSNEMWYQPELAARTETVNFPTQHQVGERNIVTDDRGVVTQVDKTPASATINGSMTIAKPAQELNLGTKQLFNPASRIQLQKDGKPIGYTQGTTAGQHWKRDIFNMEDPGGQYDPNDLIATQEEEFQLGGTYELSEDQIEAIFRAGGTVEYL